MKTVLVMDSKNYHDSMPRFLREAVRAIIIDKNKIALVKSGKEGYYKFPGGGIENGEKHVQTLKRETKEETGLNIVDSSIKEFGMVKEVRKGVFPDEIFEQNSYYYFCNVFENDISCTNLDKYEAELGYHLEYTTIYEAIKTNSIYENNKGLDFIKRETNILRMLLNLQNGGNKGGE